MKYNPNLRVQLNGGYYDLATPFYEGIYEMQHLPIPGKDAGQHRVQAVRVRPYGVCASGGFAALHDNVAAFIRRTDNLQKK